MGLLISSNGVCLSRRRVGNEGNQMVKKGKALAFPKPRQKSIREQLAKHYRVCLRSLCWIWTGAKNSCGRPCIKVDGKTLIAYRVSFAVYKKPIKAGLDLDHIVCNDRNCINPAHTVLRTRSANVSRSNSYRWNSYANPNEIGECEPAPF